MRLFLFVVVAGVTIAQSNGDMSPNSVVESRSERPPRLPNYKAEIFQCGMQPDLGGYCCQTVSKDGIGQGCNKAAPLIANYMQEVVTFDCPIIIKDVEQKNTVGACCSTNATIVTPTMSLYKCRGSALTRIDVEAKKPEIVGPILDTLKD